MKRKTSILIGSIAAVFLSISGLCFAGTLSGQVKDAGNVPLANVRVSIPELQRGTVTDGSGNFKLESIPPGQYAVQFMPVDYPAVTKQADLSKGDATVNVEVAAAPLPLTPITITASPRPAQTLTTPASVTVLEGRQLQKQQGQSAMTAIQDQPGVNMLDEGPTVVKPMIRGLSSQEIVIAEDGVRSESLQWGNEHAPEIDPLGTSRIEVMRGPNSLLYGSDALGGVISISHPELPNAALGARPLSGRIAGSFDSVNNSIGQNAELSGASGDWGYRGNLSQRHAENYHNPLEGVVPNTGDHEINENGQVGVHKDWGGVSASYGHFFKRVELQNVEAPGFPDVPLDDQEFQVLHHDHGMVKANVNTAPARFDVTAGYDWINRQEYDAPAVPDNPAALNWTQANYTLDLKANLAPMGPLQGTLGVSGLKKAERSLGLKHLTPGFDETGIGEYLVEELPLGKFNFTAGVRGDQDQYKVKEDDLVGLDVDNGIDAHPVNAETLNYSAVTGAVGGVYHITEPLAFAVNVGRGYRNPIPFELFAFGEHEGTNQFEIGNPNLKPETSLNTDASVRWASRRIKGEVGVFRNKINKYIYSAYTGNQQIGLPEVMATQADAHVQGADGAVTVAATNWLSFNGVYNMVRGTNDSGDPTLPTKNLPHMPADNWLAGFDLHAQSIGKLANPYLGMDAKVTSAQKRTGPEEVATPSYTLWNLHTGTELVVMNNRLSLDAGINNMFNKGYIDYNSLTKLANIQNPGRNVFVRLSVPFGS